MIQAVLMVIACVVGCFIWRSRMDKFVRQNDSTKIPGGIRKKLLQQGVTEDQLVQAFSESLQAGRGWDGFKYKYPVPAGVLFGIVLVVFVGIAQAVAMGTLR
jgi:hypothetical protein